MKKTRKDESFIKKPYYEGGMEAMRILIKENIRYPQAALDAKLEGIVSIRYAINVKGNVDEITLLRRLGKGCDEEAVRLVKLLKFTVPKQHTGRIKFFKKINIHFNLPKDEKPTGTEIQYELSPTKSKGNSYSYTIDLT